MHVNAPSRTELAGTGITPGAGPSYDSGSKLVGHNSTYPTVYSAIQAFANANLPAATVSSMAALRLVSGAEDGQTIALSGYSSENDGGGGIFVWNATSTTADNGGTIIAPTGVATGRWYRIYSGITSAAWFGVKTDGTDQTTNLNTALASFGGTFGTVQLPHGTVTIGGVVTVPTGVSLIGQGTLASTLRLSAGGSVQSVNTAYVFEVSHFADFNIDGGGVATAGMVIEGSSLLYLARLYFQNINGCALSINSSIRTSIRDVLIQTSGSASLAQMEVDGTGSFGQTTVMEISGLYITGSAVGAVAGLKIDRTDGLNMVGSVIESTGIPLMIASKADSTIGTRNIQIRGCDFENATDHHIEVGYGWTGAGQGAHQIEVCDCSFIAAAAGTLYGVKVKNTYGFRGVSNLFGGGFTTSGYWFESTGNIAGFCDNNSQINGGAVYVSVNGVADTSAINYLPWRLDGMAIQLNAMQFFTNGVATQNVAGFTLFTTNDAAPNTITNITGGRNGQMLVIIAANGNTTLQNAATGAGRILTNTGANIVLTSGKMYLFFYNAGTTTWVQI